VPAAPMAPIDALIRQAPQGCERLMHRNEAPCRYRPAYLQMFAAKQEKNS